MTKSKFIDKYKITEDTFETVLQAVGLLDPVKPNSFEVVRGKKPEGILHIATEDYVWILEEYYKLKFNWVLEEYCPIEHMEE